MKDQIVPPPESAAPKPLDARQMAQTAEELTNEASELQARIDSCEKFLDNLPGKIPTQIEWEDPAFPGYTFYLKFDRNYQKSWIISLAMVPKAERYRDGFGFNQLTQCGLLHRIAAADRIPSLIQQILDNERIAIEQIKRKKSLLDNYLSDQLTSQKEGK
jgi:hypothetical protein